jgi:hypothetical protein
MPWGDSAEPSNGPVQSALQRQVSCNVIAAPANAECKQSGACNACTELQQPVLKMYCAATFRQTLAGQR